jgi:hypothetical protein
MGGTAALKRPRAGSASASAAKRRRRDEEEAPHPPPPPASTPLPSYRLEYSASEALALGPFAARALLASPGRTVTCFHVANKDKGDRLLDAGARLAMAAPSSLSCCLHYSLKFQGRGDEAVRRLLEFLDRAARLGGGDDRCSVLLVSGGGDPAKRPKSQLCSAEALERVRDALAFSPKRSLPPIFVAFNPYFPDPVDRERERARLRRKLATGLVGAGGVALQFGSDPKLLAEGLAFLRRDDVLGERGTILGSIFMPTKRFLAGMRFRPWRGVFLSSSSAAGEGQEEEGYLDSVDAAERVTAELLEVYERYRVEPLVETAVLDEAGLAAAEALLQRRPRRVGGEEEKER